MLNRMRSFPSYTNMGTLTQSILPENNVRSRFQFLKSEFFRQHIVSRFRIQSVCALIEVSSLVPRDVVEDIRFVIAEAEAQFGASLCKESVPELFECPKETAYLIRPVFRTVVGTVSS